MLNHMQNVVEHWETRFEPASVHIPASGRITNKSRRSSWTLIVCLCIKLYHANIPGRFKHHLPLSNLLCNRHKATSRKLNRCYGAVWKVTNRSWAMIIQILGASILSTLVVLPENPGCLKCLCEFEADRLGKKSIFQPKKYKRTSFHPKKCWKRFKHPENSGHLSFCQQSGSLAAGAPTQSVSSDYGNSKGIHRGYVSIYCINWSRILPMN